MSQKVPVITIDGPSGSGKGTVSQMLARCLKWHWLDSGVLYRVLALAAKQHAVALDHEPGLEVLARHLDVQFVVDPLSLAPKIILEGNDVTNAIRDESCGNAASIVAALPTIRTALLERQRAFREMPGLVTDGRDMGSVIFPDASLKIFLMASPEERALRRYYQLKAQGINGSLDKIKEELLVRDLRDKERTIAPLKPAEGAVIIDTTGMNIEQVFEQVIKEVEKIGVARIV